MMGLDNPIHLVFILVLLLLVFGAKRLPEMGHSLGAGLRGFKDSISGDDHASPISDHVSPIAEPAPQRIEEAAHAIPTDRQAAPVEHDQVRPAA
jgi:sec-independent protein translocase protein TatA